MSRRLSTQQPLTLPNWSYAHMIKNRQSTNHGISLMWRLGLRTKTKSFLARLTSFNNKVTLTGAGPIPPYRGVSRTIWVEPGQRLTSEGENYTRNEWRWELHSKRVKMKTTLKRFKLTLATGSLLALDFAEAFFSSSLSADFGNYTRNEWSWELHSKRVKLKLHSKPQWRL